MREQLGLYGVYLDGLSDELKVALLSVLCFCQCRRLRFDRVTKKFRRCFDCVGCLNHGDWAESCLMLEMELCNLCVASEDC